jgi:nucleotide-binding universal stress UspA family protein
MRNVLCPVDFSDASAHEIGLAVEVCRAFGGGVVLHHNLAATAPGLSKGWEWQEAHRQTRGSMTEVEARLREMMKTIDPSIPMQAKITSGPLFHALVTLAEDLPADLIVLGSHGRGTADHASLCERLMTQLRCPLLCFEGVERLGTPLRLRPDTPENACTVLVPTDLSRDAPSALQYAFDLARSAPVRLVLLEVVAGGAAAAERAREELGKRVPAELKGRVRCKVRLGHPIDEITKCAENLRPAFLIMGEHARGLARAWLTRQTGREVLHRIHIPIWFVPSGYASTGA